MKSFAKISFNNIKEYKEIDLVPVLLVFEREREYFEITSSAKQKDNAWELFFKLFFYKIYLKDSARKIIDDFVNKKTYIFDESVVISDNDLLFGNHLAENRNTSVKFSSNRYVRLFRRSFDNLKMISRFISLIHKQNIGLYVIEKNDINSSTYRCDLNKILHKKFHNYKSFKKANLIIGRINNNILTEKEKLISYIKAEYKKKVLLGDIILDEQQESILKEIMKNQLQTFSIVNEDDIHYKQLFALALIRYAMKYYNMKHNGDFWPYFSQEYGIAITPIQQSNLHNCFQKVMLMNNKVYDENFHNKIDNITLHSFVADHSASQLFDFLFDFWKHDLGRNAKNLNETYDGQGIFNDLIEVMKNGTQNIMSHTSALLHFQQTKSIFKNRIRRIIRLIDNAFWGEDNQSLVNETGNRINHLLNLWISNEHGAFQKEKKYVEKHNRREKGEILFHSPILFFRNDKIYIILPQQRLVECNENIYPQWIINFPENTSETQKVDLSSNYKKDKIGFYVEKSIVEIPSESIFSEIRLTLSAGYLQRKFKIDASDIRFFNSKGLLLDHKNNIIPADEVLVCSKEEAYPFLLDENIDAVASFGFFIKHFNLLKGQIIILDDETGIQVGQKFQEGLIEEYPLTDVILKNNDKEYKIYNNLPKLLLSLSFNDISGISLVINDRQNHINTSDLKSFKLNEKVPTRACIIDLATFIHEEGLYDVYLTFPNRRQPKEIGSIAYIEFFTYEFVDAPYIFTPIAKISFYNTSGIIVNKSNHYEWEMLENRKTLTFNFGERNEEDDNYCDLVNDNKLILKYKLNNAIYSIVFEIPALYWKFHKNDEWSPYRIGDILLKELRNSKSKLFLRGPFNYSQSIITTTDDVEIAAEESVIKYEGGSKDYFDISKIYDWFKNFREKKYRKISVVLDNKIYKLFDVKCKSELRNITLLGDFENNKIIGDVDIDGDEEYLVSIFLGDSIICQDEPIINNSFCIEVSNGLKTGNYEIFIYELNENDEDGFDIDTTSILLNEKPIIKHLVNLLDLSGKEIIIKYIIDKNIDKKHIFAPLLNNKFSYKITNLEKITYDKLISRGGEIIGIYSEEFNPKSDLEEDIEKMRQIVYYRGKLRFYDSKYNIYRKYFNVLFLFTDKMNVNSGILLQEIQYGNTFEYDVIEVDSINNAIIKSEDYCRTIKQRRAIKLVKDTEYTLNIEIQESII